MIARYTRPEMGRIWSEENKFRTWLQVELAATETLAEAGLVPESAARAIRQKGDFELARIQAIEAEVKHDVIAFTTAVAEKVGPESRWLHYGLTSNDVVDTAQALLVKQASAIIRSGLERLIETLRRRAFEFKDAPMIGRTHGIHAEPITFGLKLANWYSEMRRNLERFDLAAEQMRVGKLSGAVGNAAHLEPEYEERICERLGLTGGGGFLPGHPARPACVLSGHPGRHRLHPGQDRHRNPPSAAHRGARGRGILQRKAEGLLRHAAQAQPHHSGTDQRAGAGGAGQRPGGFENVNLWHERDISHSSVERVILPDSTILTDYLLYKTNNLVETMIVYPERMLRNLNSTGGLVFSGQLLLDLVEAGMLREDAYRIVQRDAMRAWNEDLNFRELILADPEITAKVDRQTLERAFDLSRQLRNVDRIFARVFGGGTRARSARR